ncbi:MAG: DUF3526 domain-containing protein [Pseudomonas sp.]
MRPIARLALYESRTLLRSRGLWLAWTLLLLAGWLATLQGHAQIQTQRALIEQLPAIHQQDLAYLQQRFPEATEAGNPGYYLFMPTNHPPSAYADLAVGVSDTVPSTMKVRLLGLYSQLFDAELLNPQVASVGPYDFAFFIIFILPVWLILLCHGLLARDEEEGTGPLLRAHSASLWPLLLVRIGLRFLMTLTACLLLLLAASLWIGIEWDGRLLAWAGLVFSYLLFWSAVCCVVVALRRSSVWTAVVLLAIWTLLVLITPATLSAWNEQRYPLSDIAQLVLKQRQVVHTGWDLPKEQTFERFFQNHPEWSETAPVTERFHWKWYYAMHQVGDESIAAELAHYRQQLAQREQADRLASWWLPTVGMQRGLTGLANTDLVDHLVYLDSIAAYHAELRSFYYPLLFDDLPFAPGDVARLPRHQMQSPPVRWPLAAGLGMLLWSGLLLMLARRRLG